MELRQRAGVSGRLLTLERKEVLTSIVVSIVKGCTRFATLTLMVGLALAIGAGYYTSRHFVINTDINTLISDKLDWRQRDVQFDKAFDRDSTILAVVEAPTPELTNSAAAALEAKLKDDKTNFVSMQPLGSGEFFEKNGLLFLPTAAGRRVHRPVREGGAADRDHGGRSLDPRPDRGARDRPCRRQARRGQARQHGASLQPDRADRRERPEQGNRQFLLARAHQRPAARPIPRSAPSSSSSRSSTTTRWSPARMRPTRSARPPPISIFAGKYQRARAADRADPDRQ